MANVMADGLTIDSTEVRKALLEGDAAGEMAATCIRWMNTRENYLRRENDSVGVYCATNEYMLGVFAAGWSKDSSRHVVAAFYELRKQLNGIHDQNRGAGLPYIPEHVQATPNQA
jgi:hypothetical protein